MDIWSVVVEGVLLLLALGIGIVLLAQAERVLFMQTKFYAKLNWRMEPISIQKEIRFTRNMGKLLIILFLFTTTLIIIFSNR